MSKNKLTPEELRLWRLQLKEVKPLSKDKKIPEVPEIKKVAAQEKPKERARPSIKPGYSPEPFQRRELRHVSYEAALDMHGMSLHQGYLALEDFLRESQDKNRRIVLVITGKGSVAEENTLRHQVPRWLGESALHIFASGYSYPAKPNHGGAGAYYVRIRRKK